MPTPALNGEASISQRTGGLRSPPSTAPLTTVRTAPMALTPRCGEKPISRMNRNATTRVTPSMRGPDDVRHAEVGQLRHDAAQDGSGEHRAAGDHLSPGEHGLQVAGEVRRVERVHQPGLRRAREERESQPEQRRGDGPSPERRLDAPHEQVQEGRDEEGECPEEERVPSTPGVGHDAGRHLEDDLAQGEGRVGRERFGVAEARVEQEQGVDPPDERRGERGQEGQNQEDALHDACLIGHGVTLPGRIDGRPPPRLCSADFAAQFERRSPDGLALRREPGSRGPEPAPPPRPRRDGPRLRRAA